MINNNKILTVSYGTFSCTLEGFDDSFGTMKAIAEYFRDLAADDRYFGAEPPQPDAQMLARIAQRQISRHVDARQDEGRIVLSARNTEEAADLVATDVVGDVATAVADAAVAKTNTDAAEVDLPEPAAEQMEAAEQDIDAVSEPAVANTEEAKAEMAEPETADHDSANEDSADEDETTEKVAQNEEVDIVPSLPDADVEAFFADSEESEYDEMDEEELEVSAPAATLVVDTDAPSQERARADSIADKLKRIRAVVSQQTVTQTAPDYSEDEHAEITVPDVEMPTGINTATSVETDTAEKAEVLADTLRDLEDALDADDALEAAEETPESDIHDDYSDEESEDDDVSAILSRLDHEASRSEPEQADEDMDAVADLADSFDDDMDDNILAAMDTVEAVDDPDDENLFETPAEEEAADSEADAPAKQPVDAAPRTRVLKVKRATLDAAIQAGKLEEYDDEDDGEEAAAAAPLRKAPLADSSSLSDEAEEELARELAELEADMARSEVTDDDEAHALEADARDNFEDDFDADDVEEHAVDAYDDADDFEDDDASDAEAAEADAISRNSDTAGHADSDFSRLMEETNHHMKEPESATRRDAFAHLRAAVAAKKADEAVGGTPAEEDTGEAYRDDLASVVRPRRPATSEGARTERPAEPRPAPLKLVAEQRIDVSQARTVVPVRPRRIAAVETAPAAPTAASEATSFSDFASEMGAESLPDLLEAAAAYLSFIEGHEQFSRPQLMTKVRQVEQDNFTREDSLRSFGKLLREGKIEKLKGGRFQASEQIGFKPDARAAG